MQPLFVKRPTPTHVKWLAAVATVITLGGVGMINPSTELPRSLGRPNPEGTSI
jgi:hypothetical protein